MIETMYCLALDGKVADIMDHISNHVVIAGRVRSVHDSSSTVTAAYRRDIMHTIPNSSYERGPIQDANLDVATDIESHDVHVVSVVGPHRFATAAPQLGAPFHVGNKTDASACRPAN